MSRTPVPCGHGGHNFGKSEDGKPILAEVQGPMTVLESCLTPAFKLWRRTPSLMRRVLDSIGGELLQKMASLKETGVKIISYADPVGTEAILGPRFASALAEDFLAPFLKRAAEFSDESTIIHLCPQTAYLLAERGGAEWKPVFLGCPMTYGEACLACRGKAKFIGRTCLQNGGVLLEDGVMMELCLIP
ncbi:MAG: hypothetical protein IJU98_09345 [Synergistaceae bacterium]|nr:hypothetical protein [Synergistaceae bacterium]